MCCVFLTCIIFLWIVITVRYKSYIPVPIILSTAISKENSVKNKVIGANNMSQMKTLCTSFTFCVPVLEYF